MDTVKTQKMKRTFDHDTKTYVFVPKLPKVDQNVVGLVKASGFKPGSKRNIGKALRQMRIAGSLRSPRTESDVRAFDRRVAKRRARNKMAASSRRNG